jgi:hypothetical protein
MKGFFLQDLKRSFLNKGFFAGLLAVTAILVSAAFHVPLDRSRSSYFIMLEIFAASGFTPFAAIFPGLAYASAFCEEYSSGYLKMICSRISPKKFGITRIVTTALSGGVMLMIPFMIAMCIVYCCGVPGVPKGSDEGLMAGTALVFYIENYGEWYVFIWKVALGFLFGCVWALVGLAFAVWIPNKYVALIAPFVLYEALWLGLGKIPVLNPIYLMRGDDLNNYLLSGFMEFVYILLAALVVMWGVKRRCRNG